MVLLLSASAFGANAPSPTSPAFSPSVFVATPAPSPTPSVSPVTPPNGHSQPFRPWVDTTTHYTSASLPPTPGTVGDSDLESPHGSRKSGLPPRKDSMRYTRPRLPSHPLDSIGSFKTPELPASPQIVIYQPRDRARDMYQDSPTVPEIFQPKPVRPPQKAAVMPAQKPLNPRLSLFPAPPKARTGTVPNFSEPRPILKQTRSHTESSLPTLKKNNSNTQSPTNPQPHALRRANTSPKLGASSSTMSPSSFHALVPLPPSIPTIAVKRPAIESRRPSAVDIIASRPLSAHITTLYAGPGHVHEVCLVSSPQVEGQTAVKWVKKEDKARRKLERERSLRSQSSEPNSATRSPCRPLNPKLPTQESPVRQQSPPHSADLLSYREIIAKYPRDTPLCIETSNPKTIPGIPASEILKSPTINRPHPLRASVLLQSKRSRSEIRSSSRDQSRIKHSRNASDSSQALSATSQPPSPPEGEAPRGRTRSRAASTTTLDTGTRIPPAQGPLDIRKSTFRPFKAELDPEALAALEALSRGEDMYALARQKESDRWIKKEREKRREKEREEEKEREKLKEMGRIRAKSVAVPRSKYLEIKPLPPPKPEASYAGDRGGRTAIARSNSPLAKLARLVK